MQSGVGNRPLFVLLDYQQVNKYRVSGMEWRGEGGGGGGGWEEGIVSKKS